MNSPFKNQPRISVEAVSIDLYLIFNKYYVRLIIMILFKFSLIISVTCES